MIFKSFKYDFADLYFVFPQFDSIQSFQKHYSTSSFGVVSRFIKIYIILISARSALLVMIAGEACGNRKI